MSIYLKDIDKENFEECVLLTTNKENKHYIGEEFVASNAFSIAQSKVEDGWITKAIYSDDTMVGFTMYGYNYEDNVFELCRLMIDHKFQGKGFGREALGVILNKMKKLDGCSEIFLSFGLKNKIGRHLYESFGFKDTGKVDEGEVVYSLKL